MKLIDAAKAKKFGRVRKFENFFPEYDVNLRDIREKKGLKVLEIGVQGGGSIGMWQQYFPNASKIVGLDIDPACSEFNHPPFVEIYIGSQGDSQLLKKISTEAGPFDIVIDDGSHMPDHVIETFKTLFPLLNDGGVYVIEDLHTSYWSAFEGRKGMPYTPVGMIKGLIDEMHYWAIQSPRRNFFAKLQDHFLKRIEARPANIFQSDIRSMYVADGICFIHKQRVVKDKIIKL